LSQEGRGAFRRQQLAEAFLADHHERLGEGHPSQCRATLTDQNVGGGVARTGVGHFAGQQYSLMADCRVDARGASGHLVARLAISDDHQPDLGARDRQLTNRIARRQQTLELEIGHQPANHGDKDLMRPHALLCAKTLPVDRRIVSPCVHRGLQQRDMLVSGGDRGLTDEFCADRERNAAGQERRNRHGHDGPNNGSTMKECPSKKRLDDWRPFMAVNDVYIPFSYQTHNGAHYRHRRSSSVSRDLDMFELHGFHPIH
jgi:hypothetical protein